MSLSGTLRSEERPASCPVCGGSAIEVFMRVPHVPIHCNVQCESKAEAQAAPRGDIDLAFCGACGHVFNTSFDPKRVAYNNQYENSLHFSGRFTDYAEALADRLITKYELYGKDLLEVGCGKGEFLALMCNRGGNRGLGFDSSYADSASEPVRGAAVVVTQEHFEEAHANHAADLVCCRHVLEHMSDPLQMLRHVAQVLRHRRGSVAYFEVPNALFTLRAGPIWDLIYEHASYFTPASLTTAFTRAGYAILDIYEEFDRQYLGLEVAVANGSPAGAGECPDRNEVARLAEEVQAFPRRYAQQRAAWRRWLDDAAAAGQCVAVWGAGSKGVTFLNILGVADEVDAVIDVNPRKQGRYVPGTGHSILAPQALLSSRPDLVLVMNPIYEHEIRQVLHDLGMTVTVMAV